MDNHFCKHSHYDVISGVTVFSLTIPLIDHRSLTRRCRVLIEKLVVAQLVKNITGFCGPHSLLPWSQWSTTTISWASSIKSMPCHPILYYKFHYILVWISYFPMCVAYLIHLILLDSIAILRCCEEYKLWSSSLHISLHVLFWAGYATMVRTDFYLSAGKETA